MLARNRSVLANNGVLYPISETRNNAHFLITDKLRAEYQGKAAFDSGPLLAEIKDSACETIVISNEALSGATVEQFRPERTLAILQRVSDIFADFDTEIIYYFRRQDDAVESRIVQSIKGESKATTISMERYLVEESALNFLFFHNAVARIFPKAKLVPRFYHRSLLEGGDVCRDFLKTIVGNVSGVLFEKDEENISPSGKLVALLCLINRLSAADYDTGKLMKAAWSKFDSSRYEKAQVLGFEKRKRVMEFFHDSNVAFVSTIIDANEREAVRQGMFSESKNAKANSFMSSTEFADFIADSSLLLVKTAS